MQQSGSWGDANLLNSILTKNVRVVKYVNTTHCFTFLPVLLC